MATIIGANQVKTNDGKVVSAQNGGWYDGQQFFNGSLSAPGVINSQSNQQGAGQAVSSDVNRQSDAAQGLAPGTIDAYLARQRAATGQAAPAGGGTGAGGGAGFDVSGGSSGGGGIGGAGFGAVAPSLNLPDLYKSYSDNAGIGAKRDAITAAEKSFNDAKSKINDNPFLSEATRVGRIQKLTTDYNNSTAALQKDLAMTQADIQTKIDLQTKQFDINSQQSKAALDQFNTLLSMGALNGASGDDIAAITRATGISSGAIQAAIKSSQKKDVKTQVITSTDDNGVVTASVINAETGEVIAKNNLGAIGNASKSAAGAGTPKVGVLLPQMQSAFLQSKDANGNPAVNAYGDVDPQTWKALMSQWIGAGGTANDFVQNFSSYTDINRSDFESAYGFKKSLITDTKPQDPNAL